MKNIKKYAWIFVLAFFLNLIWENLHSLLYVHYKGGPITGLILVRAALFDASVILLLIFLLTRLPKHISSRYSWLLIIDGTIIAVLLEWWALSQGRWPYTEAMPVIPFLNTGLTPTIQLGLLAYLVYRIVEYKKHGQR